MKATGIVKRVGKSGQVNIPKNLRKTLNIREGDPFEVFTEEDRIIFKGQLNVVCTHVLA